MMIASTDMFLKEAFKVWREDCGWRGLPDTDLEALLQLGVHGVKP